MSTALDTYFPFSGGGGIQSEDNWRKMARLWLPSGVDYSYANKLEVYGDSSGRQVKVKTGRGWIDGFFGENTSEKTISLTTNTSGNPRIDRIVLQVSPSSDTVTIEVVVGTPAATPAAPALTQSGTGIYQISLAQVAIANGYSTVAAADVTGERPIALGIDGVGGGRIKLAETTLGSDTASIDWTGIPQTFLSLEIHASARCTVASQDAILSIRFNNVSSGSYDSVTSVNDTGTAADTSSTNGTSGRIGRIPGTSTAAANKWGQVICRISDYNSVSKVPVWLSHSVYTDADASTMEYSAGELSTAQAVNRITLLPSSLNLLSGTRATLYGIR